MVVYKESINGQEYLPIPLGIFFGLTFGVAAWFCWKKKQKRSAQKFCKNCKKSTRSLYIIDLGYLHHYKDYSYKWFTHIENRRLLPAYLRLDSEILGMLYYVNKTTVFFHDGQLIPKGLCKNCVVLVHTKILDANCNLDRRELFPPQIYQLALEFYLDLKTKEI